MLQSTNEITPFADCINTWYVVCILYLIFHCCCFSSTDSVANSMLVFRIFTNVFIYGKASFLMYQKRETVCVIVIFFCKLAQHFFWKCRKGYIDSYNLKKSLQIAPKAFTVVISLFFILLDIRVLLTTVPKIST